MTIGLSGRCLCGAVTFSAPVKSRDVEVCHCRMCRRWTGGPFMAIAHEGPVTFGGEENVGIYRSSEWGERGFCKVCGSTLFWHLAGEPHYAFSAGLLEPDGEFTVTRQIFIDEKPGYYDLANETPMLTGEETVAAFLAKRNQGES